MQALEMDWLTHFLDQEGLGGVFLVGTRSWQVYVHTNSMRQPCKLSHDKASGMKASLLADLQSKIWYRQPRWTAKHSAQRCAKLRHSDRVWSGCIVHPLELCVLDGLNKEAHQILPAMPSRVSAIEVS